MTRACRAPIRAAIGDAFSDAEIDEALDDFKRRIARNRQRGMDEAEAIEAAREDALADSLMEAAIKRRTAAYGLLARRLREDQLGPDGARDPAAVAALLVGDETGQAGRALSVDAAARAAAVDIYVDMFDELDGANLLRRVTDPFEFGDTVDFQRKVSQEMAILNNARRVAPTGDGDAVAVARAFHRALARAREAQNQNGAWIGELEGYIARQTHDPVKMSGGFFKGLRPGAEAKARGKWIDFVLPRLDDVSFESLKVDTPAARREYLSDIYSSILAGDHETSAGSAHDLDGYRPPPSRARSASAHRVLHFRPDAWFDYNQRYGMGSLFDSVMAQIDRGARNAMLMRVFGPSVDAGYEAMIRQGVKAAKKAGRAGDARALTGWKMRARFEEVSGTAAAAESPRIASLSRGIRSQQSLSKLGGMLLSSASDVGLASDTLQRAGVDYLDGYQGVVRAVAGMQGAARKEAARILGVSARIMAGEVASRFNPLDGANGVMGRATAMFYRVNGFTLYQNRVRAGAGASLSASLGGKSGLRFAELDAATQEGLRRFLITPGLWDVLRRHAVDLGGEDGLFLTVDAADMAQAGDIARALGVDGDNPQAVARAAREARLRLRTYFSTLVDDALTEPRARERAILRMGSQTGTLSGLFWELATQFKSFPTAVVLRHTAPAGRRAMNGDGMALAHLMVTGMALGYLSLQMKQLFRAREPLPLNGDTVLASLLQGGGLGIYGDFLFADYNRYGRSVTATVAGPAIGEIEGMVQVLSALRDRDDASAKAIRLASGNVPFANLFYTRAGLDYLLLYRLQEAVSPGYLRRYERRVEEETGADFILSPQVAE